MPKLGKWPGLCPEPGAEAIPGQEWRELKLDVLYVVYPGLHRYQMGEGIEAVPLWAVLPGR